MSIITADNKYQKRNNRIKRGITVCIETGQKENTAREQHGQSNSGHGFLRET